MVTNLFQNGIFDTVGFKKCETQKPLQAVKKFKIISREIKDIYLLT